MCARRTTDNEIVVLTKREDTTCMRPLGYSKSDLHVADSTLYVLVFNDAK